MENLSLTANQLYQKLKDVKIGGNTCLYDEKKCEEIAPIIKKIYQLKKEKNAIILAHSYVTPDIIYGVSDYSGDSYQLAKDAAKNDAEVIVFAAVKFMAETAKILSPKKKVYIPSPFNGCSLADSIDQKTIKKLKQQYPDYTFVCYINTTAEIKAECHTCVTSSNVYDIVEKIPSDKIFFVPDKLMGLNVQDEMKRRRVKKDIKLYDGTCYVHQQYNPEMIDYLRSTHQGLTVLAHPECSPAVAKKSDFVGSTSQMMNFVKKSSKETFLMLTECGLTGRLESEVPEKKFIGSCTQCRYMKSNTLTDILRTLQDPRPWDEVTLDLAVIDAARSSIEQMFRYVEG